MPYSSCHCVDYLDLMRPGGVKKLSVMLRHLQRSQDSVEENVVQLDNVPVPAAAFLLVGDRHGDALAARRVRGRLSRPRVFQLEGQKQLGPVKDFGVSCE
jgi:hypothetical protein